MNNVVPLRTAAFASVLVAAGIAFAGCTSSTSNAIAPIPTPSPTPTASPVPTAAPTTAPVAGSPLQHVVVVVMENRTVDNLFYGFQNLINGSKSANVAPYAAGSSQLATIGLEDPRDPDHAYQALQAEYDGGKLDGFASDPYGNVLTQQVTTTAGNNYALGAVPTSEVGLYWQLASYYSLSDNFFSSKLVPSFPGHQYLIAGTTPAADDPDGDNLIWGCDSRNNAKVNQLSGPNDTFTADAGPPCYNYQTLGDLLDAGNVSWKYYTGSIGTDDGTVSAYDAIQHIRSGADWTKDVTTTEYQFFTDVTAGQLPQVSWITPPAFASDHSGTLNSAGPGWVANIFLAIAQSKYYANTTVLVTWDDSGGWYDHVTPPKDSNGNSLGFRVPLIAMGPYVRPQYVSHTQHEFGSILHFIESNWGLGSLGTRDATSDNLADIFNYQQTPLPVLPGVLIQSVARQPLSFYLHHPDLGRPVDSDF